MGAGGRINSIVNIHSPPVEFHRAPGGMSTGAAVMVVAGGGHIYFHRKWIAQPKPLVGRCSGEFPKELA